MFEFIYPATTSTDQDGRILITFPDVHGATTDGADLDEALSESQDCLAEAIAAAIRCTPIKQTSPTQALRVSSQSRHRHRLSQIPRLIHIRPPQH